MSFPQRGWPFFLLVISTCFYVQGYSPVVIIHGVFDGASTLFDLKGFIEKKGGMFSCYFTRSVREYSRIAQGKESGFVRGYRPVVIVHGVISSAEKLADLVEMIQKAHPGTNVTAIDLFSYKESLCPLWEQVKGFSDAMRPISEAAGEEGIHLLCFSQGGVICRGIVATMKNHNVKNFIALSSPLMGQYGDTSDLWFLPSKLREDVYLFCYEEVGMDFFSVCQYWNDPMHQDMYVAKSNFLAPLNNQSFNANSSEWKENFLKISNMIMISGPDDGVITPWQSSHFGFYDENLNVVEMEEQKVFQLDSFGLKTLYKRNGTHVYKIPGVKHTYWHGNETVFKKAIEPWLT